MLHEDLYNNVFKPLFPQYDKKVVEFYPNGKNSIRVHLTLGYDVIFSYKEDSISNEWCLESIESFIHGIK